MTSVWIQTQIFDDQNYNVENCKKNLNIFNMQKGLPKKIPGKANMKRTSGSSGDEISVHFFAFLDT